MNKQTITDKIGILVATHDQTLVNAADRVLQIQDGVVTELWRKVTFSPMARQKFTARLR